MHLCVIGHLCMYTPDLPHRRVTSCEDRDTLLNTHMPEIKEESVCERGKGQSGREIRA